MASLAFVDVRELYTKVFGSHSHIEWNDVKNYLAEVNHTTEEWLALVHLLDFAEVPAAAAIPRTRAVLLLELE